MTPAVGWTEQDYYRASRAARRAWERTDSQLTIGLEETDEGADVRLLEPVPVSSPHSLPLQGGGLDSTSNGRYRISPEESRGSGREGA